MTYQLQPFAGIPLDEELLELLIHEHETTALPRLRRLWRYFRNDLAAPTLGGGSDGAPAQRAGLPSRLIQFRPNTDDRFQREIVIENDIGWRILTLVDFMFPRAPRLVSKARDPQLRSVIEAVLDSVIERNGGIRLWQDVALLGSVYGHVDLLLNCDALFASRFESLFPHGNRAGEAAQTPFQGREQSLAGHLRIEAVEAPRAIPLLNEDDYRVLDAFIIHDERPTHHVERRGTTFSTLQRLLRGIGARRSTPSVAGTARATSTVTTILSRAHCQTYRDEVLIHESRHPLGRVPVVHIQNQSQPFCYEGLSDVEPLIPIQDELNTRLSDRANRVTMQSFRMWLGKGIDGFTDRPIGPGQMWMTDNENASIEAFGGDADSPSEKAHIEELREALDKASGVTPAAAGHIKAKIGNLTSENALRISLMGTIAKVKRKRITYGRGVTDLCDLILHALHAAGALRTEARDRQVEIIWPDPLPADESRRIQDALAKAQLGVPLETLRAELGYGDQ